jgi:hypothetical protein
MHDNALNASLKKYSMIIDEMQDHVDERQFCLHRVSLIFLLLALLRRHRRMEHIFSLRGNPMNDYFQESLTMEREHMANLITMTQKLI